MEQQEALQLKDIHLPESPDFWPPALGWWLLLVAVILSLFWAVSWLRKRRRAKQKRIVLLNSLDQLIVKLRRDANSEILGEINILLRQIAVNYYPRSEIASLTGVAWLQFLDQSGKTSGFSRGVGRVLVEAPYQQGEIQNFNSDEFVPLVRGWVKKIVGQDVAKHSLEVSTVPLTSIKSKSTTHVKPLKSGGV